MGFTLKHADAEIDKAAYECLNSFCSEGNVFFGRVGARNNHAALQSCEKIGDKRPIVSICQEPPSDRVLSATCQILEVILNISWQSTPLSGRAEAANQRPILERRENKNSFVSATQGLSRIQRSL